MLPASSHEVEQLVDPIEDQPVIKRRPLDDNEMDITPMIDITFLLLIFFLVAGQMDKAAPVDLPPARHGTAVGVNTSVIITIAHGSDNHAEVYLGDSTAAERRLNQRDLEGQEAAIIEYVEEQLRTGKDKTNVLIKAEGAVKHRDVARVSNAVGKVNKDLYVAVMEVK